MVPGISQRAAFPPCFAAFRSHAGFCRKANRVRGCRPIANPAWRLVERAGWVSVSSRTLTGRQSRFSQSWVETGIGARMAHFVANRCHIPGRPKSFVTKCHLGGGHEPVADPLLGLEEAPCRGRFNDRQRALSIIKARAGEGIKRLLRLLSCPLFGFSRTFDTAGELLSRAGRPEFGEAGAHGEGESEAPDAPGRIRQQYHFR